MKYYRLVKGVSLLNLASLVLIRHPRVLAEYLRNIERLLFSYAGNSVRVLDIKEIVQSPDDDKYFVPVKYVKHGTCPFNDLFMLAVLCKQKRPVASFEIGTFEGLTAAILAKNSGPASQVITLDLPWQESNVNRTAHSYCSHSVKQDYRSGYLIDELDLGGQVTRLIGDSALFNFVPYEKKIDFFFIDGAHTADYVAVDTLHAFKCISDNGWVVWHDCFVPEVFSVIKSISKHLRIWHIRDSNLAVTFQRPKQSFPWEVLERSIS